MQQGFCVPIFSLALRQGIRKGTYLYKTNGDTYEKISIAIFHKYYLLNSTFFVESKEINALERYITLDVPDRNG